MSRGFFITVFPACNHGFDIGQWSMAGGCQVKVGNKENQHHVSRGSVNPGHFGECQSERLQLNPVVAENQQQRSANPDQRVDHQLQP
jgi:hypothetical protein